MWFLIQLVVSACCSESTAGSARRLAPPRTAAARWTAVSEPRTRASWTRRLSADRVAGRPRATCLTSRDPQRAEVEDRRGEHGVRARVDRRARSARRARRRREAITGTDTSRAHQPDQLEVEAVLGAVGVHRVEQDLAGAEVGGPPGPLDRVEAGATAGRRAW